MDKLKIQIHLVVVCLTFLFINGYINKKIVLRSEFRLLKQKIRNFNNDEYFVSTRKEKSPSMINNAMLNESVKTGESEYSFFDEAVIYVRAGSGGQGASTYKKQGIGGQDGTGDGGNGGKGGDVILSMDNSLNNLAGLSNSWRPNAFGGSGKSKSTKNRWMVSFRVKNGDNGKRGYKNGRYSSNMYVRVPCGTIVQEIRKGINGEEVFNDIGIVDSNNVELLVVKGGDGGEGTGVLNKKRGIKTVRVASMAGEKRLLKLTLKIVADVALVGVPNAGKSTFLASVTKAKPKIANYPFTTVIPNLGVWIPSNSNNDTPCASSGLVLCDVPGLIQGAASGSGLGHAFLRHVERCHVILHIVDATSSDPIHDFNMLNKELIRYGNGKLANMPQIVVVNKLDAWNSSLLEWEQGFETNFNERQIEQELRKEMTHSRLMWISAKHNVGVQDLMNRLFKFVQKVKLTEIDS